MSLGPPEDREFCWHLDFLFRNVRNSCRCRAYHSEHNRKLQKWWCCAFLALCLYDSLCMNTVGAVVVVGRVGCTAFVAAAAAAVQGHWPLDQSGYSLTHRYSLLIFRAQPVPTLNIHVRGSHWLYLFIDNFVISKWRKGQRRARLRTMWWDYSAFCLFLTRNERWGKWEERSGVDFLH